MAASSRIAINRRLARFGGASVRGLARFNNYLVRFLGEELAPNPRRIRLALRVGVESAVGMGLLAAMHIGNILGAYVLFNVAAAGVPMIAPATALVLVAVEGVALLLSHPIAGILVEAPWLILGFFALITGAYTYAAARLGGGATWLMVEITFLGTFYIVVFAPNDYGWEVASTFSGVAVAFLVLMLFDTVLWPEPAEAALLESMAAGVARTRQRLAQVGRGYYADDGAELPEPRTVSRLPSHLALLASAARERSDAHRDAVLLAFVTVIERLFIEVARLTVVARESAPRSIRMLYRPEIEAVLDALDHSMARLGEYISAGIHRGDNTPLAESAAAVESALKALDARIQEVGILRRPEAATPELSNIGAFSFGLRNIARLLERSPDDTPVPITKSAAPTIGERLWPLDHETARYSTKVAVAIAIAYVVGLTTRRGDLTVILWTVIIAGLPTYGATYRKMLLRLLGGVVGGLAGLAAIIIVTPNFETVLSYMMTAFVVLTLSAYAAQSSNRVNYLARQAGTSFVLIFAGLSPNADIYAPLWRVWGMTLGLIIVAAVFLIIWPEYSTDALPPRLRKMLKACIDLLPGGAAAASDERIQAVERAVMKTAGEVLTVADDARLEGRSSTVDPDRIVDAAGTLRRIAFRAGSIATGRLPGATRALSPATEAARGAFEAGLRTRLQGWLDYFENLKRPDSKNALAMAARLETSGLEASLQAYVERLSARGYAEIADWPPQLRAGLLAEIESYHRFVVLAEELNFNLSRVPLPARG